MPSVAALSLKFRAVFIATLRCCLIPGLLLAGAASAAPGDRIGPRIDIESASSLAALASNSAGEWLITWRVLFRRDSGLMAQRFSADGIAADAPFVVADDVRSDQPPSVAMNASGAFVIAWVTPRREIVAPGVNTLISRSGAVMARRYAPGGVPLGAAFEVAAQGDEVDIAIDDAGNFAVAWIVDGNHGRTNLYVALGFQPLLDLAIPYPGIDRVQVRHYRADGGAQAPVTLDRQIEALGNQARGVSVAMASGGASSVVWARTGDRTHQNIVVQRFRRYGEKSGPELIVNEAAINERLISAAPDSAMSASGDLAIAWEPGTAPGPADSIRIAVLAPDNTWRVAPFMAGPGSGVLSLAPKIVIDAEGYLGLTAGSYAALVSGAQARFFSPTGIALSQPLQLLPPPATTSQQPSGIALDGAGRATIAVNFSSDDPVGQGLGVQRFQAR